MLLKNINKVIRNIYFLSDAYSTNSALVKEEWSYYYKLGYTTVATFWIRDSALSCGINKNLSNKWTFSSVQLYKLVKGWKGVDNLWLWAG